MLLNFTKQFFTLLLLMSSLNLFAQAPANNECSGAEDISVLFGQGIDMPQTSGIFDNTNATSEASDPTDGWDCFAEPFFDTTVPQVENTLWFSFTGDGNEYFITIHFQGRFKPKFLQRQQNIYGFRISGY